MNLNVHEFVGMCSMFRLLDTLFPKFSGAGGTPLLLAGTTIVFVPVLEQQPLGLGILVGPDCRNASRGICQEREILSLFLKNRDKFLCETNISTTV